MIQKAAYGQLVIGSFITIVHPLMHHIWCRAFWWIIKSRRWLSPPPAEIWHPTTSGFSQHEPHLCEGRGFRLLMRFRKIRQGSWKWLGELCKVPRCLLWRGLRHQCPMYSVSCISYLLQCLFFIVRVWILARQTSYAMEQYLKCSREWQFLKLILYTRIKDDVKNSHEICWW